MQKIRNPISVTELAARYAGVRRDLVVVRLDMSVALNDSQKDF